VRRAFLLLAAALPLLALADRALVRREAARRAALERVAPLLSPAERDALRVAAVRVETAGGQGWTYARVEGRWRCVDLFGAPADGGAITALVKALTEGIGELATAQAEEAPRYGVSTGATLRVALLGPGALGDPRRDVQAGFDVGSGDAAGEAAFVRVRGRPEVWRLDSDPRAVLEARVAPGLPPLLERSIAASSWPGWAGGVERIFVDRADAGFELARRLVPPDPQGSPGAPDPASPAASLPSLHWVLDPGPDERPTDDLVAQGYALFFQRAPYVEVLDPARRDELGLERPAAVVTLAGAEGAALELALGVPLPEDQVGPEGRVPVWNGDAGTLYLVTAEVADLLVPQSADLAPTADGSPAANPYDRWLR